MGKNMPDPPNLPPAQNNTNSGCVNKLLHALNRRHRWQNVRKVLPNKRQGSGKHIIDGATGESTASTSQPPQVQNSRKKNKPQNEQSGTEPGSVSSKAGTESGPVTSKASKKFKIRSLISDEMSKKRGKHQPRHSSPTRSSPTRSPSKRTNSVKHTEGEKPVTKNACESPSTIKKRKCDICAAMLTVSYLRQKGQANEHPKQEKQPTTSKEMLQVSNGRDIHYINKTGLPKSFSFPFPGSTKQRDFEVEELKRKLRDCKDIETTKEKILLPMKKDSLFPKPMLTRPASFKSSSSTSQKENKQTTNQTKTLRQKIGRVMKESKETRESREKTENRKKEKRRILMDAVFHKIPYGRRNSKDPKKVSPDKIKSSSTSSGIDRMDRSATTDKGRLKKTASTSEAMSKYRRLLSQTSTRDEKSQLTDHKPRLCVARDHSCATVERKKLKKIRSMPTIRPSDFKHHKESPVKTQRKLATTLAKGAETRGKIESVAAIETLAKENKLNQKDEAIDGQKTDDQIDSETKLVEKDEPANESLPMGLTTSDHDDKIDNQNDSSPAIEMAVEETEDEAVDENLDQQEYDENEKEAKETKSAEKDENLEASDQENADNQKESSVANQNAEIVVDNDKSFNEILGMFKKVSDEKVKQEHGNESGPPLLKITTDTTVKKDSDVEEKVEVSETTLDHQEKETPCSEIEGSIQDSVLDSPSLIDLPQSPLIDLSEENEHFLFSIDDQPSVLDDINQSMDMSPPRAMDVRMSKSGFLHLDSVKGKNEFKFVKKILERSGFLDNEHIGEWYSSYQPIDPSLFEEVETAFLQKKNLGGDMDSIATQKIINDHHLLLFDLINEGLLDIHNKTCTFCPHPLTYRSKVRPMPVGHRILEEVWDIVHMYLSWKPVSQPSLDDAVSQDLEKGDGWMNLQADAEFVGIELEEMLTDDLLDELVFDDLLM